MSFYLVPRGRREKENEREKGKGKRVKGIKKEGKGKK